MTALSANQLTRVDGLLDELLDLPVESRAPMLDRKCVDDAAVHAEHSPAAFEIVQRSQTVFQPSFADLQTEMLAGHIKPTHIMAVMRKKPFKNLQHWKNMTPEFCVRMPD